MSRLLCLQQRRNELCNGLSDLMISTDSLMKNYLLCCDWGTSFFRLQLMNTANYCCIGEILSPVGVAGVFTDWKTGWEHKGVTRRQFFRQQMCQQIDLLAAKLSISLTNIPVVISGMASSSIGMDEIPYAALPFAVDGSQTSIRRFEHQPDFPHDILLISGVSSASDVMRGEETQLIGLIALLDLSDDKIDEAIFIFPGTHSKHMYIQSRQLTHFETYMTGEVFAIMANESILKDSVDIRALSEPSGDDINVFKKGVNQSNSSHLLNSLFTVRTNQLFDKLTKKQNAFYLSGLVIGTELNHLREKENLPLVLCSGRSLAFFYKLALDELHLTERTLIIPAELVDRAASVGQMLLFHNHFLNQPTP